MSLGFVNGPLLLLIAIISSFLFEIFIINGGLNSSILIDTKQITKDLQTYHEYNYYAEQEEKSQKLFNLEHQELKTPTLASLKLKFPNASTQELKKKLLMAVASQLDELNDDDVMSTSFKSQAPVKEGTSEIKEDNEEIEDEVTESNEYMDNYMGAWLDNLYAKAPNTKDKGKKQAP